MCEIVAACAWWIETFKNGPKLCPSGWWRESRRRSDWVVGFSQDRFGIGRDDQGASTTVHSDGWLARRWLRTRRNIPTTQFTRLSYLHSRACSKHQPKHNKLSFLRLRAKPLPGKSAALALSHFSYFADFENSSERKWVRARSSDLYGTPEITLEVIQLFVLF